ncbi:MAG: phosphate acyltransferase PlsX [Chloroflexi bacterium]|nr:phosphate acyltransferase PlsX [Chloroflexota bacterium]
MLPVALDAVGGDHAPAETVRGALDAARRCVPVLLVGPEAVVAGELARQGAAGALPIADAPEIVEMAEHPAAAVRSKKRSSIAVGLELVKAGKAAAFVSAGNSGAVMAAAIFGLGRLPGVERPAIGGTFPCAGGKVFVLDIGANADCRPTHLLQFARMGHAYVSRVFGIARPRIGLLSIGEEPTKGNQLVLDAHPLLQASGLNFVGNVEGKDVLRGAVDVCVADGFTGNVVLKWSEGIHELLMGELRQAMTSRLHYRLAAAVLRPAFRLVARKLDYSEYGGAPLLGVDGVAIISHGRSNARAIAGALRVARQVAEGGMVDAIREGMGST